MLALRHLCAYGIIKRHIQGKGIYYKYNPREKLIKKEFAAILNNNCPPLLIYQFGKCGSTSVWKSLEKNEHFNRHILHVYELNPERIKNTRFYVNKNFAKKKLVKYWQQHVIHEMVSNLFIHDLRNKELNVISFARDINANNISRFFKPWIEGSLNTVT